MNTPAHPAVRRQPRQALRYPAAVAALLSACALAPLSQSLFAQTQAVTGFNDNGWNADDVRTSAGVNIVNSTTHAPGSGAALDENGVAAQIDWRNVNGTLGNLGGVFLTGTSTGSGKSTISVVNTTTGLADSATALGSGFGASYRWQNTDTVAAGISFKIGIQSTAWAASQAAFTATRSGEATWDLLLVCDPSQPGNSPGNTTTNGAFVTSTIDHATSKFFLFGQAGNAHFSTPGGSVAKTLAEWADDPTWGPLLFGTGAKVSNTQFGFGSGNAAASALLDFASVSYLDSGARIDFVDAVRHTGPGTDFGDAATWGGIAPSSTQNLVVEHNATLDVSGAQTARSLGILAGTTGIVLAEGSSLVLNSAENGTLSAGPGATVGVSGPGTLQAAVIEAGGTINLASTANLDGGATPHPIRDGTSPSAKSRYGLVVLQGGVVNLQSGADVTLKNDTGVNGLKTMIRVGEVSGASGPGVLNIAPGASLSAGSLHGVDSWGALHVGDWGGQGEVNQTGGDVSILGAIVLGNEGGSGVYNLSGGTVEVLRPVGDNGALIVGRATNNRTGSGTLNISGGTLTLGGAGGDVSLVVGGLADNVAAYANASGTVNQTGGVVRVENGSINFGRGTGAYNLNGGTLEIGGAGAISATTGGTYAFNLGGGTLKVVGANLTSPANFNVVDTNPNPGTGFANVSTSTIDTNGLDASLSGALTGAGYLIKTGLGTLTLSGSNNLTGQAYVTGGVLRQTAGTSAINYFAIGSGADLTGAVQMAGGSLDIAQGFQVGDWGGSGSLDQTGGSIVVGAGGGASFNVGNQGGTGTYNLSGGSFTIANGFANLGRSLQATAGDGVLNLSGTGVFEVGAQGDLIVGDRDGTGAEGNGTVNQTGGTLRVASGGELWIGAYGAGAYNLNGGALELGGASLKSNYGNGGGGYAFTLGGGTIKVVGSDLNTSVNADLAPGTADRTVASRIDTNGLNATWSGNLAGAQGGLIKAGAGVLNLAGNVTRSIGYLNSDAGSIHQSAGTTDVTEFVIGSNYAAGNGAFVLSGGSINLTGSTAAASTPSLRVGDFGGTGVFTQQAGTVAVGGPGVAAALNIGNQGGSGTYNLEGGNLVLAGGLNVLGRSSGSNPASSGVLNVSGGVLELTNGSSLIVGNNFNRPAHGTGVVNQTGGTVRVSDGALFVAGYGNGSYNLNDGVLEVGGSGLRARYNNTLSTSVFTLGGGTLKVIGSNLATDVAPVLAAGTTSTIHTNGFDATLSSLSGASGHLDKVGAGRLSVGSADIGALTVRGGSLEFTGAAALQSLTVQSGATLVFGTEDLSVAGNVTFDNGSTLALSIAALDDLGTIGVGGSFTFGSTATLTIAFANGFAPSAPATFQLFTFSSFGGSFAQVNLPTVAGHTWNTSTLATDGILRLETSAIPEPAAATTLAGLALLGHAALRRRRRAV